MKRGKNYGRQTHNRKTPGGRPPFGKSNLICKSDDFAGDELSYHEHHGETEVYHILSGEGLYQDNDKTYPVEAEMTTFCEDGNGHAISCKGDEPLVFLAMIQKKEA